MRNPPPLPREPGRPGTRRRSILLIAPFYAKDPVASFGKHVLTPATTLTGLAGATPDGWDVRVWDENLLMGAVPADPLPQVVGITVQLTYAARAYELADWFRARGSLVVLGGLHVDSCPDEVATHADAIVIGNGVAVWPGLLADVVAGALKARYVGTYRAPYADEPSPRRELLPRSRFLTIASVVATRGCHNRCGFCVLSGPGPSQPYQMRRVEDVAREIAATGEPYAVFIDNNLGSKPEYLRSLCRALKPLRIIWSAAVTIDVADDPTLVREMGLAGCTGVFVGLETLKGENLAQAHKRSPDPHDYGRRVAVLHDNGIQVNGSFVFGFDADGPDVFESTVGWIERNRLECATFHILTPYPGTPFFEGMKRDGRILTFDWSLYDTAHVVYRPLRMSPERLQEGYAWAYEQLFSMRSIWARRPEDRSAVASYLGMSLLYKKSNPLWVHLIRTGLTGAVWKPLVEATRLRQLHFRRRLERRTRPGRAHAILPAGV